jgi:hypothetical protein
MLLVDFLFETYLSLHIIDRDSARNIITLVESKIIRWKFFVLDIKDFADWALKYKELLDLNEFENFLIDSINIIEIREKSLGVLRVDQLTILINEIPFQFHLEHLWSMRVDWRYTCLLLVSACVG